MGAEHNQEVALMLFNSYQRPLIKWKAHGPCIMAASFHTKKMRINMDIIHFYILTNDSDGKDKYNLTTDCQP
ncbi:hypothetical protein DPMN_153319 [Dreissena polymorpha]|uniref:Uncharacterized protein n=1 Tax=Dreissena polymorpha TaxID=45954 RepID=A0A9D4FJY3_DREPO|nr:hypothetical protein DPMN_153319 [Dreissena polymorpha]